MGSSFILKFRYLSHEELKFKLFFFFQWDWDLNLGPYTDVMNHTSSPFCSGYFRDGSLSNYLSKLALSCNPPDLSHPGI
jgi:hypothetical protein